MFSPTRGMDTIYVDPWIRNDQGFAALTFNRVPIATYGTTGIVNDAATLELKCYISGNFLVFEAPHTIQYAQILTSQGQVVAIAARKNDLYIGSLPKGVYVVRVDYLDGSRDVIKFLKK